MHHARPGVPLALGGGGLTMSKWTPGPWAISRCKCGHPICQKWVIDHSSSNGMFDEADARLIAEAPAMADLIKRIVNSDMAQMAEDEGRKSPELTEARALLKRINATQLTNLKGTT